jgi:hypothetical protein
MAQPALDDISDGRARLPAGRNDGQDFFWDFGVG